MSPFSQPARLRLRATTYGSPTQLTATILASDIAAAGSLSITVFTPAPGGGTSGAQTLTITGPALAVSVTQAVPGDTVTVTLTHGPGNTYDWIGLAPGGSPDTTRIPFTYQGASVSYIYVGAGVTDKSWTVTMPNTVWSRTEAWVRSKYARVKLPRFGGSS